MTQGVRQIEAQVRLGWEAIFAVDGVACARQAGHRKLVSQTFERT